MNKLLTAIFLSLILAPAAFGQTQQCAIKVQIFIEGTFPVPPKYEDYTIGPNALTDCRIKLGAKNQQLHFVFPAPDTYHIECVCFKNHAADATPVPGHP